VGIQEGKGLGVFLGGGYQGWWVVEGVKEMVNKRFRVQHQSWKGLNIESAVVVHPLCCPV
jgi:hypothetical protein